MRLKNLMPIPGAQNASVFCVDSGNPFSQVAGKLIIKPAGQIA